MRGVGVSFATAVLCILLLVSPAAAQAVTTRIKGVIYEVNVLDLSDGVFTLDLTIKFKVANYTSSTLTFPIGWSFVSANLTKVSVVFKGQEVAGGGKLATKGVSRVDITLKSQITGPDWAEVTVVIRGQVKSGAKIETTYPKEYTPVSSNVLNVPAVNYFQTTTWENDGSNPGVRIRVCIPEGWSFAYALSSITSKVATLDLRPYDNCYEFLNLDTSTIKPKSLSPGASFSAEVGILPSTSLSDPRTAIVVIAGAALVIFFLYYYRDVYKYVERKVGS